MKPPQICAAFPGTGKTTVFNYYKNDTRITVLDSDSSQFDRAHFPGNYIKHIKENINQADTIFVSSHAEVRDALVANNLLFTLVYPDIKIKEEYLCRYKNRGNSSLFIKLIDENWNRWITECQEQLGCIHVVLPSMVFIANVFDFPRAQSLEVGG